MLVSKPWQAIAEHLEELGAGGVLKVRPEVAARIWQDPDQVRFATEIGFPYCEGLFHMSDKVGAPDPKLPDTAFDKGPEPVAEDTPVGSLWLLGWLYTTWLYVRPADGSVWCSDPDHEEEYERLHTDLSSFSYMLYAVAAERPTSDERPTPYDWADAYENIKESVGEWDPQPFADENGFWERFLDQWELLGERD